MRATLTRSSPLLARPANSSISFGGSPAASTRTGVSINSASWRQRSYAGPMSTAETRWGPGVNAEAIQAWDGPLYDRWVRFRHVVTKGLGAHGDAALALVPPQQGQRVLDVGCGLGDTTQQIAELVGPDGEAVGVDAAERFIETATAEAAEANVAERALLRGRRPDGPARRAVRHGLLAHGDDVLHQPGGRAAQRVQVARPGRQARERGVAPPRGQPLAVPRRSRSSRSIVQKPEEYDEPDVRPGPFSMANADTLTDILGPLRLHGHLAHPLRPRHHRRHEHGRGAATSSMSIGPAGEILRAPGRPRGPPDASGRRRAARGHGRVRTGRRRGLGAGLDLDRHRVAAHGLGMAERRRVGMLLMHGGTPKDLECRERLAEALPEDAVVGEPDEVGVFEIELDAEDQEDALTKVWNGVAASGTDDHVLFLEHPELPEHWQPKSGSPQR